MANTFRQYLQAETIILQVDLIVCFRNLQKRTDDAVSLFGDKEAGGICVLKGYKEYYYGYDGKAVYVDLIDELQSKYPLTEPQIIGESAQKAFIGLFGAILRMRNLLSSFDDFAGNEILSEREMQDYQGRYNDLYDEWRNRRKEHEKEDITDDIVFEVELIKQNLILENPVYCGKIAYGRRTLEKVKGKKNEYKRINATDYITVDGLHESLVSEEIWNKAQDKRQATGQKFASKYGKDRTHLLTGLLKCPVCGGPMYANRHCWTKKDGTYKEVGYYVCGRNKHDRGKFCDYKADLKKSVIEPLVIEAVKEIVSEKYFAQAIKDRIGSISKNDDIDKEIKNFENRLNEIELNKARLEKEIDTLPFDTKFRERKLHDMNLRLDGMYEAIAEIEELIADANLRKKAMEEEAITLENIYKILLNFSELFDIIEEDEQKNLLTYLIKEIQLNPHWENKSPLKWIEFNFPIYRNGEEVRKVLCEENPNVETLICLKRKQPK